MNDFSTQLRMLMDKKGFTGEKLGKLLNVSKSTVIHWANGRRFPNESNIRQLTSILNVSFDELFAYDKKTYTKLPLHVKEVNIINGYVGAGSSGIVGNETTLDKVYIDINTIKQKYQNDEIQGLQVIGDSMAPYVNSGDIVLYTKIDTNFPKVDGKYIINKSDDIMVKNIQFCLNGDIIISSENKSYKDDVMKKGSQDYFSVIGIVVGRILKG